MNELVINRLEWFGYEVVHSDLLTIKFIIEKIESKVKTDCNIDEIPEELNNVLVDMVVGNFFLEKKTFDPDSLKSINFESVIKQIQEGDTNIIFSDNSKTPEQRFDELINYLINKEYDFSCYRKIRW